MSVSNDPKPHFPSTLTGTATDPTTAYTFGAAIDMRDHLFAKVNVTTSGDEPTSFETKLQWSDDGTNFFDMRVKQVSGGNAIAAPQIVALQDEAGAPANDTYDLLIDRGAARYWRLAIKRTGGGAGTLAVATYTVAMG